MSSNLFSAAKLPAVSESDVGQFSELASCE